MERFAEELMLRMENHVCFEIPLFGGIPVSDNVAISWGIIAFLVLMARFLTYDLKIVPGRRQIVVEIIVSGLLNFFKGLLGEKGVRYAPYMATVAIFIATSNLVGLVGLFPPTKDVNITGGLAIMSILTIEYARIHERGVKGWIRGFAEPMPVVLPINIMEIFIRPMSLCMRLFGNILGGFVVMEMLKIGVPFLVPVPFSLYFDIFDGLIQTYVFVLLTSLFIKEAVED